MGMLQISVVCIIKKIKQIKRIKQVACFNKSGLTDYYKKNLIFSHVGILENTEACFSIA